MVRGPKISAKMPLLGRYWNNSRIIDVDRIVEEQNL